MAETLHSKFQQWLADAKLKGELSDEAYRLGEVVLRYVYVSERVPNPTPELLAAADEAMKKFKDALNEP